MSNTTHFDSLVIRPKYEGSIKLEKGMIDLSDIIELIIMINYTDFKVFVQHFKGFEMNLFDDS